MRRLLLALLATLACGPADPTDEGSTGDTGAPAETTAAPTTGAPTSCDPPTEEPIAVLVQLVDNNGLTLLANPGELTCDTIGDGCDCIAADIDRLELDATLAVGAHDFMTDDGPTHTECAKGDDGCSQVQLAGTLTLTRADVDCVAGRLDFGNFTGNFAAIPCGG